MNDPVDGIEPLTLPRDVPPDVRVWRVDVALDAPLREATLAVLAADELEHARRFHRHEDTARFASVRAALRMLLANETGADAARLALVRDGHGRPALAAPGAPDFNVSHSGAHGLIAISRRRRVGVDIEQCADGFDWRPLADSVLGAADLRAIEALPAASRAAAFFDCWTAKEALLKARGVGVAYGMNGFSVLPRTGSRFASLPAGDFRISALDVPPGYAACVAWSDEPLV